MRDSIDADVRKLDMKLAFLGAVLVPVSVISLAFSISTNWIVSGGYPSLLASQVFFVVAVVGGTFLFLAIRGLAQSFRSASASRYAAYGFACGIITLVFVCLLIYSTVVLETLPMFDSYQPLVLALWFSASGTFVLVAHVFFMKAFDFLSEKTTTRLVSKNVLSMSYISVFVGAIIAVFQILFAVTGLPFLVAALVMVSYVALVLALSWASVAERFFKLKIPTDTSHEIGFPKTYGGVLIAISLAISIMASTIGLGLFDIKLAIPTYYFGTLRQVSITGVITIITQSFTIPLILGGVALVVLALKSVGEHYSDSRIVKNAVYGFIFLTFCSAATMISTLLAHTIYLTPVTPVTPPLTEFTHRSTIPLIEPETDLLFSWPSLISLMLSSVFFARALVLLSDRSRKRGISAIAVLLVTGTFVTIASSAWILDLRNSGYDRFSSPVLFNTEWHLDQILVWITLLGIGLLLVAWAATSTALNSIKKELLRKKSNTNQRALQNGQQNKAIPQLENLADHP